MRTLTALSVLLWLGGIASAQLATEPFVSGLSGPVGFVQDPIDPDVQYVIEQAGRIRVIDEGVLLPTAFLDLTGIVSCCGERGLLGMAFPPDHDQTGRFYVNFTNPGGNTVVSRFRRSMANPLAADPTTRFDLRWPSGNRFIAQPYSNHNGGNLAFGPDGYLYIGLGDGGDGNDPQHRAQDPATLLGKMLRIDVDVADADPDGYRIPPDNPFVDDDPVAALDEIWAFGLRNPWRYSFDDPALGGTGALITADVGQGSWEEIDYEPAGRGGRNYGWRNREGAHDNVTSRPPAYSPLTDPIAEYDHTVGRSITGGDVYRGGALPTRFIGQYFFSDFVQGRVWSLGLDLDPVTGEASPGAEQEHTASLGGNTVLGKISAMGTDSRGEMHILNYVDGTVLKIVPTVTSGDLFVDFGSPWGLWARIDGVGWQPVHWFSPVAIITADPDGNGRDDLIVDFGPPYGIWEWFNNSAWVPLHPLAPESMVRGDLNGNGQDDIVVDFGNPYGIHVWLDDTAWVQLHNITPVKMVTGDLDGSGEDDVVVDFGAPYGVYTWLNNTSWVPLHPFSPLGMTTGDLDGSGQDDVVVDFGPPYGIYTWFNNSAWVQLHGESALRITTADLDGSGQDDVVVDFGPPYGTYTWFNDAAWVQLHGASGVGMTAGDLDGNGEDDVVVDFGSPYGIYAWQNNAVWVQVHQTSPEAMAVGRLEGR